MGTIESGISVQSRVYTGLLSKDAYPHEAPNIQPENTHISWIFLAGPYAYKVKRQIKFGGILDFSTLRLRKKYCYKEVELNRRLCKSLYLGVVGIVALPGENNNRIAVAKTLGRQGKVVEYAVKMKRIAAEYRMDLLLADHKVSVSNIRKIASILSKFHSTALTNETIQRFGQPKFMKSKIKENFCTMSRLGYGVARAEHRLIRFVENNERLFLDRIKNQKIRDIHGDLYLKNIFIVKDRKYYLYDRIEFNDSLRYADIAEDVAHLSMDLEYHKRRDLRMFFVKDYVSKSKDYSLEKILDFLICYKAFVRAKVSSFQARSESTRSKKSKLLKEADSHVLLAEKYLQNF
jgi:aminoglycoside phosphotransferase family enzyme